jgi:hypothetical protein
MSNLGLLTGETPVRRTDSLPATGISLGLISAVERDSPGCGPLAISPAKMEPGTTATAQNAPKTETKRTRLTALRLANILVTDATLTYDAHVFILWMKVGRLTNRLLPALPAHTHLELVDAKEY